ncbi:class IIb bacteriocin, lactobin A/cerein 7B family [Catenovulum agarivorans]|uniref:class IIb bacteriocin, lactobin A/cerein 7B family n=1 Tax=Catenovulum agarivorans TaxID=1172192 RepID=UPI0004B3713B|nr:class IIb bacteriocin, lactobin A/cerein 7B family [Catenovulum agarivorans]
MHEIRELTVDELEAVNGGVTPTILVSGAIGLARLYTTNTAFRNSVNSAANGLVVLP